MMAILNDRARFSLAAVAVLPSRIGGASHNQNQRRRQPVRDQEDTALLCTPSFRRKPT